MKTAEEWKTEWRKLPCGTLEEHETNATTIINQIQLDAMREGMRRAAEIAQDDEQSKDKRPVISKAILAAAEQLTTKDL